MIERGVNVKDFIEKWERCQAIIRLTDQNLWEEICDDFCDIKKCLVILKTLIDRVDFTKLNIDMIVDEYNLIKEIL